MSLLSELKNDPLIKYLRSNEKLFAHIHLSTHARFTGYEGEVSSTVINWAIKVMASIEDDSNNCISSPSSFSTLKPQLRKLHHHTCKIEQIPHKYKNETAAKQERAIRQVAIEKTHAIAKLAPGDSFLIKSGFQAHPEGHTMYIRFYRREDALYTLYIYDAHLNKEHKSTKEIDGKHKVCPLYVYDGVTFQELFFGESIKDAQPEIMQALIEQNVIALWKRGANAFQFDRESLLAIFAHINHRIINPSRLLAHFMTVQRSGTCSQKSLNALLVDLFEKTKDFRAFVFDSRLHSLVNFYHAHADNLHRADPKMDQVRSQLRLAAVNMVNTVDKYFASQSTDTPAISREYAEKVIATAEEILTKVTQAEEREKINRIPKFGPFKIKSTIYPHPSHIYHARKTYESFVAERKSLGGVVPISCAKDLPLLTPQNLKEELSNLLSTCEKWKAQGAHRHIRTFVEAFLQRMPIPNKYPEDDWWSCIPEDSLESCYNSLDALMELYFFVTVSEVTPSFHYQYHHALLFLVFMHQLIWRFDATKHDQGFLQQFDIATKSLWHLLKKDPFQVVFTPELYRRQRALEYYLYHICSSDKLALFNFRKQRVLDPNCEDWSLYLAIVDHNKDRLDDKELKEWLEKVGNTYFQLKMSDDDLLALELFQDFGGGFCDNLGLKHITTMKRVVLRTHAFVSYCYQVDTHVAPSVEIQAETGKIIYYWGKNKDLWNPQTQLWSSHSIDDDCVRKRVVESDILTYLEHDQNGVPNQNRHLLTQMSHAFKKILGSACHPRALVPTLLQHLHDHMDLIEDKLHRELVQRLLFKCVYNEGDVRAYHPLYDEFSDHATKEVLLKQFRTFFKKALNVYFVLASPEHFQVEVCLFLLTLGYRISDSAQLNAPLFEPEILPEILKATTSRNDIQARDKMTLHLLHILVLNLGSNTASWSREEAKWTELLHHWISIQSLGKATIVGVDRVLYHDVEEMMTHCEPHLMAFMQNNQDACNRICTALVSPHLKKNGKVPKVWKITDSHSLTLRSVEPVDDWIINLSSGTIANIEGALAFGEVSSTSGYLSRLFKSKIQQTKSSQRGMTFEDPAHGWIHIANGDSEKGIQRLIESKWYTYIPPEVIQQLIPRTLWRYHHWMHVDESQSSWFFWKKRTFSWVISDGRTGRNLYTLNIQSGDITKNDHPDWVLEGLDEESATYLKQFEHPESILCWNKDGIRQMVEFPRYQSEGGSILSFINQDGLWCWKEDPRFNLASPPTHTPLNRFSNFLYLINRKTGLAKMLIPCREVVSKGFSSEATLVIPQEKSFEPADDYVTYEVYTVVGDRLVSSSHEATLFLVELFLSQKNYDQALSYLKMVSAGDRLNESAKERLQSIIASGGPAHDHSPNGSAVRLYAYWILKKTFPLAKKTNVIASAMAQNPHKSIGHMYSTYVEGLNNVYQPYLLDKDVELDVIRFIGTTQLGNRRKEYLLEKAYPHGKMVRVKGAPTLSPFKEKLKGSLKLTASDLEVRHRGVKRNVLERLKPKKDLSKKGHYERHFLTDYRSLKNGSHAENEAFMHRYWWRRRMCSWQHDYDLLIHLIYQHPEKCPEPPRKRATDEELLQWYTHLVKVFEEVSTGGDDSLSYTDKYSHAEHVDATAVPQKSMMVQPPLIHEAADLQEPSPRHNLNLDHLAQLDRFDQRLAQLQRDHLLPLPELADETPIKLRLDTKALSEDQKPFQEVIQREVEQYENELTQGKKRCALERLRNLKMETLSQLKNELNKMLEEASCTEESLRRDVLRIIRRSPNDAKQALIEKLEGVGRQKKKTTLKQITQAAMQNDREAYLKLNAHLSHQEIRQLHSNAVEHMVCKTTCDHVKRILNALNEGDYEKAAGELALAREYQPQSHLRTLYFEYVTGFQITKDQSRIIDQVVDQIFGGKPSNRTGITFQLIMGGGKTSVILSHLIALAADQGCLPVFIAHHSQLTSVRGTLRTLQQERFDQGVLTIDPTNEELNSLVSLENLLDKIEEAHRRKWLLVISSGVAQMLQLKLISLFYQRSRLGFSADHEELDEKITILQAINKKFYVDGVAFLDEVDLVLDIKQVVNVPVGEKRTLPSSRLHLVRQIYEILTAPALDKITKLTQNRQNEMTVEQFNKEVVPKLLMQLCHSYEALKVDTKYLKTFIRYATGTISTDDKNQKDDKEFLEYFHYELHNSEDPEKREAAHLIALTGHLIQEILPFTLSKEGNKHYGRDDSGRGRVCPYLGVGTPAKTEFGDPYVALCYRFQTAVHSKVEASHVSHVAKRLTVVANHYVAHKGERFYDTAEAAEFHELTSVALDEIEQPQCLEKAVFAINRDVPTRLRFEAEAASFDVSYYGEFIENTPIDLVDQFSKAIADSGILYNAHTYHTRLQHIVPDQGAEGKVLHTLMNRNLQVIEVPNVNLDTFLDKVLTKKSYALMDGGGLLKGYTGLQVARGILEKTDQKTIRAVVFLHRDPQTAQESFAMLKRGEKQPHMLRDTSVGELTRHGIALEEQFVYFDQLRTTGTDISVREDCIAPATVEHQMTSRSLSQQLLRLRKFFSSQDAFIVATTETKEAVMGNGNEVHAYITNCILNQGIEKAQDSLFAYPAQQRSLFRSCAMPPLFNESNLDKATHYFCDKKECFVKTFVDDPYKNFGMGRVPIPSRQFMKNKVAEIEKQLMPLFDEGEMTREVVQQKQSLVKKIDCDPLLEFTLPQREEVLQLGFELEQALERKEMFHDFELDQEEQRELNLYLRQPGGEPFIEIPWKAREIEKFDHSMVGPDIASLQDVLYYDDKIEVYETNYSPLFPKNVYITQNFRMTSVCLQTVFHPSQHPVEHILVRRTEGHAGAKFAYYFLSAKDYTFFKRLKPPPKDMWLITANGQLSAPSASPLPSRDQLELGLFCAQIFEGNLVALTSDEFEPMTKDMLSGNHRSLFLRFLRLKIAHQPKMKKLFMSSALFNAPTDEGNSPRGITCQTRLNRERLERMRVAGLSQEEIAEIPADLVQFVPNKMVPHLSQPKQIKCVSERQLPFLTIEQIRHLPDSKIPLLRTKELIQSITKPARIQHFTEKQMPHITKEQLPYIQTELLKKLEDRELIRSVTNPNRLYHGFGELQAPHITVEQYPHTTLLVRRWMEKNAKSDEEKRALIGALRETQYDYLTEDFIPLLSGEQLGHLTSRSLIHVIPNEKLDEIPETLYRLLSIRQLLALKKDVSLSTLQFYEIQSLDQVPKQLWRSVKRASKPYYKGLISLVDGDVQPYSAERNRSLIDQLVLGENVRDEITLSGCLIPEELYSCCYNATELNLRKLNLGSLHQELERFTKLTTLSVQHNHFKALPDVVFELGELKELDFSHNQITEVSIRIRNLKKLTSLNLMNNDLETVPKDIFELPKIKEVNLSNNPINTLPNGYDNSIQVTFTEIESKKEVEWRNLLLKNALSMDSGVPIPLSRRMDRIVALWQQGSRGSASTLMDLIDFVTPLEGRAPFTGYVEKLNKIVMASFCQGDAYDPVIQLERSVKEKYRKKKEEMAGFLRQIEYNENFDGITKEHLPDLFAYCRMVGKGRLIPKMILQLMEEKDRDPSNKIATGFFLDKSWVHTTAQARLEDQFYGWTVHMSSSVLARELGTLAEEPGGEFAEYPIYTQELKKMHIALSHYAGWACTSKLYSRFAEEVMQAIDQLGRGDYVLIPVLAPDHQILLEVCRQFDKNYRLTVINTGAGVRNHYQWPGTAKYQTALVIDDVPEESLFNRKSWEQIGKLGDKDPSTDKHYRVLLQKLGKGGTQAVASNVEQEYGLIQEQGTCGFLPLWHWVKHRFTELDRRAPDCGYALYRVCKARVSDQIFSKLNPSQMDKDVYRLAELKLRKHREHRMLYDVVQCKDKFWKKLREINGYAKYLYEKTHQLSNLLPKNTDDRFRLLLRELRSFGTVWAKRNVMLKRRNKKIYQKISQAKGLSYAHLITEDLEEFSQRYRAYMIDCENQVIATGTYEEQNAIWSRMGWDLGRMAIDPRRSALFEKECARFLIPRPKVCNNLHQKQDRIRHARMILANSFAKMVLRYERLDVLYSTAEAFDSDTDRQATAEWLFRVLILFGVKDGEHFLLKLAKKPEFEEQDIRNFMKMDRSINQLILNPHLYSNFKCAFYEKYKLGRLAISENYESLCSALTQLKTDLYDALKERSHQPSISQLLQKLSYIPTP